MLNFESVSKIYGSKIIQSAGRVGYTFEARDRMKKERENILKLSEEGLTAKEIEEKTGVSRTVIYKMQHRYGFAKARTKAKAKRKQIEELVKSAPDFTYTLADISRITGIDRKMTGKYIRETDTLVKGENKGQKNLYKFEELK